MEANDKKKGICRVCLNVDCEVPGEGLSLFEKFNDVSYIYEKINYITSIEIKEDDNLPDRICSSCLLALESACNFKEQCESSDAFLRSHHQLCESLNEQYIDAPVKEEEDEFDYDYSLEYSSDPGTDTKIESENTVQAKLDAIPFKSKAIDLKLECHDCGGSFKSKCKLRVHWKKEHLPQQLICPLCKKAHRTYKSFHSHMKRKSKACTTVSKVRVEGVGRNRIFYCKECDVKSTSINTLTNHILIHSGERLNVCEICGKAFAQLSSLSCHKETHKDVKELSCKHCGKKFKTHSNWYRHEKGHTVERQPCNVCGKMYASKDTLREHMKRHSGIKSISCELCSKAFYTNSELRSHIRTVHKKEKYACQQCDYKTLSHSLMSRHCKGHKENKISCDYCGTFVDNKQQLILHKKRHLKNIKCTMCEKKFFSKKSLMVHARAVHNFYISRMGVKKERDAPSA